MADKKECRICREMTKQKYKYFKLWKILAIVFMVLTAVFAGLYFASGDIFKETNNEVEIVNEGNQNESEVTINN